IETALSAKAYVQTPQTLRRGDPVAAMKSAPHTLSAEFSVGGQEHFYLEGQIAFALPGEDGDLIVHSSTQHPTEVQHICAQVLGCDYNRVTTVVRRLGGAFGGKESNASWVAAAAALGATKTGKPVKLRLPREIDIIATGKRHGFDYRYTVGFDDDGRVLALDAVLAADAGFSLDMTPGVVARALTHVDNAYWLPHVRAVGYSCRTNKQSNTAFRGFGGPQGVLVLEDAIDRIARHLGRDANEIRALNFYGAAGDETPYGQKVEENHLARCWAEVKQAGEWERRRAEVDAFNKANPVLKRGLGLFPLKFGISFNLPHLNQAGALVHIYTDGSIRLNHGGTEMGQGLFIKVAQVVAEVFKVDIDRIRPSATSTAEVPNTSPTAASTGSDLNGWAAYAAADTIKQRMIVFAAEHFGVAESEIEFADNTVRIAKPGSNQVVSFNELARLCYLGRVPLSSTGYYKTPKIHWDGAKMKGRPFFYFSFGAAAVEVAIDTLTGESRVLRADLVQDCGASLNPAIDLGQIEGAFVQGQGWLTCEELWWDEQGRLKTVGPSTYKIPGSRDAPAIFNVKMLDNAPSKEATIFRSKAVGEPPLMLATAVWTALKDAIAATGDGRTPVRLDAPATPERILAAIETVRPRISRG
ncbi:MAG TPA: xanthine dehydrogenase molybdopterin binding subunit, partial [Reyranella sp.]|nr:xanthine dehydrogenase molybdopterin binding subunit [Reyranella sp.]